MNNPLEQFDRLYSSWSMADKVAKEMQLIQNWQNLSRAYMYLVQLNNNRGYLSLDETKKLYQLQEILQWIRIQKVHVDNDLTNEMAKHIAKMMTKQ